MPQATIFTRFLAALGVPHTAGYSDAQFRSMTFKSLFGLSHLLADYGVPNQAFKVADKEELAEIPTPFLAQTQQGIFVIVTDIDTAAGKVTYDSLGQMQQVCLAGFERAWNGIVLLAWPDEKSREPEYSSHRFTDLVASLSKYALLAAALVVAVYFFITRHVYSHLSLILVAVFDCVGLFFSYLLMQKSLGIHSGTSDHVCGILEQGGCDSIMELKVSKLFGVFSWSEVGFGYFGISLITLLLFPHLWPALALCNVCCLPYTVWSIWYQKFLAKHWCTLCVGVQTTLWLLFFSYLIGGWQAKAFPLNFDLVILIAVYVFAVLLINLTVRTFKKLPCHEKDS